MLTPEQRAIVVRMGDLARQYDEALRHHERDQAEATQRVVNAVLELQHAIDRGRQMQAIFTQYGNAFAEFVDTLA
jgi:alkylated DNA nucleotide flippase Atl1